MTRYIEYIDDISPAELYDGLVGFGIALQNGTFPEQTPNKGKTKP